MVSAAAVTAVAVAVTMSAEVAVAAEVAVGSTAAVAIAFTPYDLMRFRFKYFNFLDCIFPYSLEIIFRNLNN